MGKAVKQNFFSLRNRYRRKGQNGGNRRRGKAADGKEGGYVTVGSEDDSLIDQVATESLKKNRFRWAYNLSGIHATSWIFLICRVDFESMVSNLKAETRNTPPEIAAESLGSVGYCRCVEGFIPVRNW